MSQSASGLRCTDIYPLRLAAYQQGYKLAPRELDKQSNMIVDAKVAERDFRDSKGRLVLA